ncbi:gliding motility-associated ABC transporter substrate-binding protein GldG [Rasiella rasia]|uniref:Gliding motility-associated ABC transporter substrate-binding protein GldG n=1 Tax=Rasiella rasia TaxID=2744027 RepID=A0A6G6GIC5_9FLAO|nr:gliding motility-associated ABC transporter substrate-binding protein GldG [Rasiella rasia]QIE58299.1 gliding motility-associated ABC transporter substrate-binding protein GldG [Rasiella rasia]
MKNKFVYIVFVLLCIVAVNVVSHYVYSRFDMTQDKRYTLSKEAKETVATVNSPIVIDVFLQGNFPPEFKRLQIETEQLLAEFANYNPNIKFNFVNPLESDNPEALQQQFASQGMKGAQVEVRENGKVSTEIVYPWALAYFNERTVKIPLLKNTLGATSEERINNSVQNLEYAFAEGFHKLINAKSKRIAVVKGNGELDDRYVADLFSTLRDTYYTAPFTLDSAAVAPLRTLEQLNSFDLAVIAKPTEAFTDAEKYILDQFTMNGGASIWLVDGTELIENPENGNTVIIPRELNLGDFFFKYGVRINPNVLKDVYCAPIVMASGDERDAQYNKYPWLYHPLSASANDHPIVNNIEAVKFEYVSGIDTLPNAVKKTILLSSSPITKKQGTPIELDINKEIPEALSIVNQGPNPSEFNAGETPTAVLLEGEFPSVFSNRIKPFKLSAAIKDKTKSSPTRMLVISDGDVIKNQLDNGRPLELGFDKWTQAFYGNKEFLLNAVNYMLDDSGLINIRNKKIAVPFLDPQKTIAERSYWQLVNILLPLTLLAVFGFAFGYFRKRKYTR